MEKAISLLDPTKVKVEVEWKPFFLAPDMPDESVDKRMWYNMKFGSDRVEKMIPYMKQVGEAHGIHFSYGGKVGKTLLSHRLLELAKEKDPTLELQDALVEALFKLYFEDEGDINSKESLATAAAAAGVFSSAADALKFLNTDVMANEVKLGVQEAYSTRISGVPFFRLPGGVETSGAQEASYFVEQFRKMGLPFRN